MNELSIKDMARLIEQQMPHAMDVGMKVDLDSPPGKIRMRIPAQPMLAADPEARYFFPGVLFSLADTACGLAAGRQLERPEPMSTLDLRVDYLASAPLKYDLVAEADCCQVTRSVIFVRCELHSGPHQRLVASATGAFMRTFYSFKGNADERPV
ncbi:thioesterase [Steroidobacter denitrificans]|uniref:Thioesterase n=1 Tax=Steroidobacter denitrificans TaxID=465721 RepID=A0A127F9E6_STEDE|nr:PaaI family thioesterase [Steroidobacter denitrificans]AMN46261.1 thioesterase [Steroidobacter denitrificans]